MFSEGCFFFALTARTARSHEVANYCRLLAARGSRVGPASKSCVLGKVTGPMRRRVPAVRCDDMSIKVIQYLIDRRWIPSKSCE